MALQKLSTAGLDDPNQRRRQVELLNQIVDLLTGSTLGNYADDTAAAAGGVEIGGLYRNGSVLQIRVT